MEDVKDLDAVIVAVAHDEFKKLSKADLDKFYRAGNTKKVLVDIKGVLDKKEYMTADYHYWRL